MKYNSREDVTNLRIKFCNEIEDLFRHGDTIEFTHPFNIYITEDNEYDATMMKVPYLVKTMTDGKYLEGVTPNGDEFDEISIYDLEDIVEVAYILDTIGDKQYKLI